MRKSLFVRHALVVSIISALAACSSGGSSGTALALVSTLPANGATNVPIESDVSATFGAALASASVTTATFYLTPAIDGAIQVSGSIATFKHATPFQPSTMYTATLAATIGDGAGHSLNADQTWTFTTGAIPDTTAPAAVNNLAAGTPTTTTVPLTWTAVGNDGESGTATTYNLRYATGSGCPLTAGNFASGTSISTSAPLPSGQAESVTATGLTASTAYCFGIIVGDAAGNLSPLSNIVTATTAAVVIVDTTPPAAVTDLAASATSPSAIALSWTAPGDNGNTGTAASYDLRQASGSDCPITDATFTSGGMVTTSAPDIAGTPESANATALTASTEYCFAIKTTDAAGNISAISNIADVDTEDAPLGAIVNLAVASVSNETVNLTWTSPAHTDASSTYDIYYNPAACPNDPSTFVASATGHLGGLAVSAAGATEAQAVSSLLPTTAYCFGVTLTDGARVSALSNLIGGTTGDNIPPAQVSTINVSAVTASGATLSWTAPGDNGSTGATVASYNLRSELMASGATDCSAFSFISTSTHGVPVTGTLAAAAATQTVAVTGLTASSEYCFAFTATDAAGNVSAVSGTAFVHTADAPLGTITDLAVASVSNETVNLSWTSPAHTDSSSTYDIYYIAGSCPADTSQFVANATGHLSAIAVSATGMTEMHAVSSLLPTTAYCFGVTLTDGARVSALSNLASGTTGDNIPPGTVASIAVGTITTTTVALSWTAPGDNGSTGATVASYDLRAQIQSAGATDCSGFNYASATPNSVPVTGTLAAAGATQSVVAAGLTSLSAYCFALTAKDVAGNVSAVSGAAFAMTLMPSNTTPPAMVTDLAAANVTSADTEIDLSWTAPGLHDESGGPPASYLVRYQSIAGNATDCSTFDFDTATPADLSLMIIVDQGTTQTLAITGLSTITNYCFGLKASDQVSGGDVSALSNVVLMNTYDDLAPLPMTLTINSGSATSHSVTFTAPAPNPRDVDGSAKAKSYDLRFIAASSCAGGLDFTDLGTSIPGVLTQMPSSPGTTDTFVADMLPANTLLCFAIASIDANNNESPWSQTAVAMTLTDSVPPDAVSIVATYGAANAASLSFTMTADDGSDPTSGSPVEADAYISANGNCPITAGNLNAATLQVQEIPPQATAGQTESIAVSAIAGDVLCYAVKVIDGAGNVSAISNSPVQIVNGPVAPTGAAATNLTSTSLTFGWTSGSGDGTAIATATSYSAAFTQAASCTGFTLVGSTPITGLPTPLISGNPQSVPITGLNSGTSYCFGIAGVDAYGDVSPVDTVLVTTAVTPQGQIQAVRDAIETATATPINFTTAMEIDGAIVSYVKTATGAVPDGNGFFVQNTSGGPALYFGLDPTTFLGGSTMSVGDVLDVSISQAQWLECTAGSCTNANSMYVVTAATGSRVATGDTVPAALPLASTDVMIPLAPPWTNENVLVSGAVMLTDGGTFATSGGGYEEAPATTGGDPNADGGTLTLRLPNTLISEFGLVPSCIVNLVSTPTWRFNDKAELSAWATGDIGSITNCPSPTVTSVAPANNATNVYEASLITVTFSSAMQATGSGGLSVQAADGPCSGTIQLSTSSSFTNCVGGTLAAASSSNTEFLFTPAEELTASTTYSLKETAGVKSLNQASLQADNVTSFTTGTSACTASQIVISQVYGGGGNSGASYQNDFVELYNRGTTPFTFTAGSPFTVQYGSSTASSSTSWSIVGMLTSGTIPANGYFLVEGAAGTNTEPALPTPDFATTPSTSLVNLSSTDGRVALVNGTTKLTGCPATSNATVVDLLIYGSANATGANDCTLYGNTASISNTTAAIRFQNGCDDTDVMSADFAVITPNPHNSASPATAACVCQ